MSSSTKPSPGTNKEFVPSHLRIWGTNKEFGRSNPRMSSSTKPSPETDMGGITLAQSLQNCEIIGDPSLGTNKEFVPRMSSSSTKPCPDPKQQAGADDDLMPIAKGPEYPSPELLKLIRFDHKFGLTPSGVYTLPPDCGYTSTSLLYTPEPPSTSSRSSNS